jgi:hypothetical protein
MRMPSAGRIPLPSILTISSFGTGSWSILPRPEKPEPASCYNGNLIYL